MIKEYKLSKHSTSLKTCLPPDWLRAQGLEAGDIVVAEYGDGDEVRIRKKNG